jgi:hypothetical protein
MLGGIHGSGGAFHDPCLKYNIHCNMSKGEENEVWTVC